MAYTVEKLLSDATTLVSRLKEHDCTADILISQTQTLHKRIDSMKEYQDDITELNEIAKHRPRSTLVIGIAQENRQIRELQQENRELRLALEEHQSALELIMKKYREHVNTLIETNKMEKAIAGSTDQSQDLDKLINKICEMANVMQKSVSVDEDASTKDRERLTQLEIENKGLRELLEICSTARLRIMDSVEKETKSCQTGETESDAPERCDSALSVESDSSQASVNTIQTAGSDTGIIGGEEKQETEDDEKSGDKTPENVDSP